MFFTEDPTKEDMKRIGFGVLRVAMMNGDIDHKDVWELYVQLAED